ncbi:methyltransferase domain-containing protein [Candidatus Kaiserbacteria bacterium]|nr:methyltransferase domain-containing protein [Candidatus Kaiserbacteria bacterium]
MPYNKEFFDDLALGAETSAEVFVPIVYEKLKPKSVLDVGCGTGSWLKIWSKYDVSIFGIDGNWVKKDLLCIPENNFKYVNLEEEINLNKKFDLVVSLEVAEHIHKESASQFVKSLVNHGDKVLFSAAIPWQGGTDHFNEQWPTYWIELFLKEGYEFLDPFRHLIWNEEDIKDHYRQNTLLFVKKDLITGDSFLEKEREYSRRSLVSVVHPNKFVKARDPFHRSLKYELPIFFKLFTNFLRNLIKLK